MRTSSCRRLPAAALRGLAKTLLARLGLRLVQRQEIGLGHEHLAADFDQRGGVAMQPVGHRFHGAEVGGDVLAFGAVAAGGAADETAVLIGQVDRQAVDLRFGDEHQRFGAAEKPSGPGAEFGEFGGVERVVERQHRHAVAELGEAALRRAADRGRTANRTGSAPGKRASIAALRRRSAS